MVRFMWGEFFYSGEMIGGGRCAALFLCLKNFQKKFKKNAKKVLTNIRRSCII